MTRRPGHASADGWHRLHWASGLVLAGRAASAVVVVVLSQGGRPGSSLAVPGGLAAVAGITALAGAVVYLFTHYRVTDTELQVDSGLLFRRQRRLPLDRLQSVDVVRPLLARLVGLAEVRVEVAGGKSEGLLRYLADDTAQGLQLRLLRGRSRTEPPERPTAGPDAGAPEPHPGTGTSVPLDVPAAVAAEPPEHVLVRVPTWPLVAATLLDGPVLLLVGVVLAAGVAAFVDLRATFGVVVAAAPALLPVGQSAYRRLMGEQGFTVAETPDGLRVRSGLLDTRATTILPGRVQVLRVREPLLWRPFGWARLEVDLAAHVRGREESSQGRDVLLPVAPKELAHSLTARVLGTAPPTVRPPARARWAAPLSYPRLAFGLDGQHAVATSGVLTRRTDVMPLARVQSVRMRQGPWQRRLRLATLELHSAGRRLGSVDARDRDAASVAPLLLDVAARARSARSDARP